MMGIQTIIGIAIQFGAETVLEVADHALMKGDLQV